MKQTIISKEFYDAKRMQILTDSNLTVSTKRKTSRSNLNHTEVIEYDFGKLILEINKSKDSNHSETKYTLVSLSS